MKLQASPKMIMIVVICLTMLQMNLIHCMNLTLNITYSVPLTRKSASCLAVICTNGFLLFYGSYWIVTNIFSACCCADQQHVLKNSVNWTIAACKHVLHAWMTEKKNTSNNVKGKNGMQSSELYKIYSLFNFHAVSRRKTNQQCRVVFDQVA